MDKGQAHIAVILIVILALAVTGIVIFVVMTQPQTGGTSWTGGGWTPQPLSSTPMPGAPCPSMAGLVYDCDNQCVDEAAVNVYIGDYDCDDGVNSLSGMNLNCAEFQYDGGDCSGTTPSTPGTTPGATTGWCPTGVSQPFAVGGITGTGTVNGLVTYEGEEMCKATLATSQGTAYYYENQAGDHYYMTDSVGTLLASWEFPMGIDSTGGTTGAWTWMLENAYTTITEGNLADFVNAKVVTEADAWATYPPECDLSATPFSADGGNVGLRTCNMDAEIVDLGVMDIYDVWKLDASTFNWVSNPTATVGHVYVIKARDGSQHRIEVTSISADYEEVTFVWVSGV